MPYDSGQYRPRNTPQGPLWTPKRNAVVGIENAYVDTDGDLIILLNDETIINAGKVVGDAGIHGSMGPRGLQGERGPQGPQGPAGANGSAGEQGPQGIPGPQGEKGDQGPQGIPGPQGERGPQGEQGIQGIPGPQGVAGEAGPIGLRGPQGERGEQGPQGERGLQGLPGPQGPRGLQGEKGAEGKRGKDGKRGIAGTGIKTVSINDVGELLVTLTDDRVVNAGKVSARAAKDLLDPEDLGANHSDGDMLEEVGPQGPPGPQGPAGPQGETGVGIGMVEIDASGHLIITYTDYTTQDAGSVYPTVIDGGTF